MLMMVSMGGWHCSRAHPWTIWIDAGNRGIWWRICSGKRLFCNWIVAFGGTPGLTWWTVRHRSFWIAIYRTWVDANWRESAQSLWATVRCPYRCCNHTRSPPWTHYRPAMVMNGSSEGCGPWCSGTWWIGAGRCSLEAVEMIEMFA